MAVRKLIAAAAVATGATLPMAGLAFAQQPPGDRDCEDFPTQQEAQRAFESVPGDPERLDGDNDGIACEDPNGESPPPPTPNSMNDPGGMNGTDMDDGMMPSGGVDAGHGGTAGDEFEVLLPLGLAGGAVLAAGSVVVVRRRATGRSS